MYVQSIIILFLSHTFCAVSSPGKTEAIKNYIDRAVEQHKSRVRDGLASASTTPRILAVTFRTVLAWQLSKTFGNGFVCYQEPGVSTHGQFTADRLVVQLDSLLRVLLTHSYDYLILDEVLSLLLYSRSSTIQQRNAPRIFHVLNRLISEARHVLVIDAHVDDLPSYLFVRYLERSLGVSATWIHNEHRRENKRPDGSRHRAVEIHICKDPRQRTGMSSLAFEKVWELVNEGRRVFVPSTSKSVIDGMVLLLERGNEARVVAGEAAITFFSLTSVSDERLKQDTVQHMDETLVKYQVFLTSPVITAGPSMVASHFTDVVGWGENRGEEREYDESTMIFRLIMGWYLIYRESGGN